MLQRQSGGAILVSITGFWIAHQPQLHSNDITTRLNGRSIRLLPLIHALSIIFYHTLFNPIIGNAFSLWNPHIHVCQVYFFYNHRRTDMRNFIKETLTCSQSPQKTNRRSSRDLPLFFLTMDFIINKQAPKSKKIIKCHAFTTLSDKSKKLISISSCHCYDKI